MNNTFMVGIEKINFYTGSLVLDLSKLALKRNRDVTFFKKKLMINERSYNPNYEDVITMAVNVANPMLSEKDKKSIGMCIFATESGLDFSKSNSTYVCNYLGLNNNVRNFEIKNACYSATCALQTAVSWIASGCNNGKKALVISSDINYFDEENRVGEETPSVGAISFLISTKPEILAFELGKNGFYTFDCFDYARPNSKYTVIDAQESMFAYLECLNGSWKDYKKKCKLEGDLSEYFNSIVYHSPFGGLVKLAHKQMQRNLTNKILTNSELEKSFERDVFSSLYISMNVGNIYSSSVYAALISLIAKNNALKENDRIGIFSYGPGAASEFYSVKLMSKAKQEIKKIKIEKKLEERYKLKIEEFEEIETISKKNISKSNYEVSYRHPIGWYKKKYKNKHLLVLKGVKNYARYYKWS